jgi:penicillin amidase
MTANDRRSLAIEALRSHRGLEAEAEARGMSVASLRAILREYFRAKLAVGARHVRADVGSSVRIVRDRWGVVHVFGESLADVYFGFGLAVGRDRLWQLEYRRRWAYGRLAEVMGESAVASDKAARTLDFAALALAEMEHHPHTTSVALDGYARGINAAIAQCGEELPAEFDVLGFRPEPWTAADCVTISRASLWQFSGRIENLVIAEVAGRLPNGLGDRFMRVEADEESIVPAERPHRAVADRRTEPLAAGPPLGSNQWTVGPRLSRSGAPLFACDGHIPFAQPSTRYEVHLCGGGVDIVGMTDPGVPVLTNGRNRHAAWGRTNNVSSNRDLYLEHVDPRDPDRLRDGGRWVRMRPRVEHIDVRGGRAVTLEVRTTPRGPIVNHLIPSTNHEGDPSLSLRWVGLEPHDSITPELNVAAATTIDEMREAHRGWQFSGQNPGFADRDGHIAYQMRGRVPTRGRIVRGFRDATNEDDRWGDPIPFDALPHMVDPPRGWTGSSNERPLPSGHPLPLYGAYGDGYRSRRMKRALTGRRRFTLAEMGALQNDVYSERADGLKGRVANLVAGDASLEWTAKLLRQWDCRYGVGSRAAAVFTAFWWHWTTRVAAERMPVHLVQASAGAAGAVAASLLRGEGLDWFVLPSTKLEDVVRTAMRQAIAWLSEHLGDDRRRWSWGRLHTIRLTHPLSAGRPIFARYFDVGPYPCPGSQGVLNQNAFRVGRGFETVSGPHYRFLCDLAEAARAEGCNTAGNSGQPASPHYRDQSADWLAGRYHPLLMDAAEIEANAVETLTVSPGAP